MKNKKLINILGFNNFKVINKSNKKLFFNLNEIKKYLYKYQLDSFYLMKFLSKKLRSKLNILYEIKKPKILKENFSFDGTIKWLFKMKLNNIIETIFIPEKNRRTLCVSSQIGCPIKCPFCITGSKGFYKNLKTEDIIDQIWFANKILRKYIIKDSKKIFFKKNFSNLITNIVVMGMGEPLLNYKHLLNALLIINDKNLYAISMRRITVSTSGIVPMINRLSIDLPVCLAVSLHATNDILRNILVPINRKYSLNKLIKSCKKYIKNSKKEIIMFEYVMLRNINDFDTNIMEIINIINSINCKINIIPFNIFEDSIFNCSSKYIIKKFEKFFKKYHVKFTIRKTRGLDINAACGQLSGKVKSNIKNFNI